MPIDPKDFAVVWEPEKPRKGIQYARVFHKPTATRFSLKAAKCVTDQWVASTDPAVAQTAWLREKAVAKLTRILYEASPEGKRDRLIEEARMRMHEVVAVQELCENLKRDYPAQANRIPTITITEGDD